MTNRLRNGKQANQITNEATPAFSRSRHDDCYGVIPDLCCYGRPLVAQTFMLAQEAAIAKISLMI